MTFSLNLRNQHRLRNRCTRLAFRAFRCSAYDYCKTAYSLVVSSMGASKKWGMAMAIWMLKGKTHTWHHQAIPHFLIENHTPFFNSWWDSENPLDFGASYFQTDPYDGFFRSAAIKKSLRNLIVAGRGIKAEFWVQIRDRGWRWWLLMGGLEFNGLSLNWVESPSTSYGIPVCIFFPKICLRVHCNMFLLNTNLSVELALKQDL